MSRHLAEANDFMKKMVAGIFLGLLILAGVFLVKNKTGQTSQLVGNDTSVDREIQSLLAKKYGKSLDEVQITMSKQDGNFAGGSVLFGQGGPGEGGMFLARKAGNGWEVVFDGNGNVDCNKMRQEDGFPDTILKPNFCN